MSIRNGWCCSGRAWAGAVLTRLATERPVGGLVLRSPFTSLADVGAQHYPFLPVRALLRHHFPTRDTIGALERVPWIKAAGCGRPLTCSIDTT